MSRNDVLGAVVWLVIILSAGAIGGLGAFQLADLYDAYKACRFVCEPAPSHVR